MERRRRQQDKDVAPVAAETATAAAAEPATAKATVSDMSEAAETTLTRRWLVESKLRLIASRDLEAGPASAEAATPSGGAASCGESAASADAATAAKDAWTDRGVDAVVEASIVTETSADTEADSGPPLDEVQIAVLAEAPIDDMVSCAGTDQECVSCGMVGGEQEDPLRSSSIEK